MTKLVFIAAVTGCANRNPEQEVEVEVLAGHAYVLIYSLCNIW